MAKVATHGVPSQVAPPPFIHWLEIWMTRGGLHSRMIVTQLTAFAVQSNLRVYEICRKRTATTQLRELTAHSCNLERLNVSIGLNRRQWKMPLKLLRNQTQSLSRV